MRIGHWRSYESSLINSCLNVFSLRGPRELGSVDGDTDI